MKQDRQRLRRIIDVLGGLQKMEEELAAQHRASQDRAYEELREICDLAGGETLTATLFSDLSSRYTAGLLGEIDRLTEASRHNSGEALRHGMRVRTLSERDRQARLREERDDAQRDVLDRLLTQTRTRQ